jgi:hypothetical protein
MGFRSVISIMSPKSIVFDSNANAVIEAIESTGVLLTESQKLSCNNLIKRFKSAQIWTLQKALYGILGGTANAHKWNWVNPLDTNPAYRLTFAGTWTHSATGMLPSSAYADTFLSTSAISLNSVHLSYYSRTNSSISGQEMGALQNTPNSYTDLGLNHPSYGAFTRINNGGVPIGVTNSDSTGFYIASRIASNILNLFKNSSKIRSGTDASNATTTRTIYIGGINNQGTPGFYTNRQCAFASIGSGLTDGQASDQFNIVEQYQVDNGRGVVIGWKPTTEIGTGTNNNYELPFKGIYNYSQSGCIYLTSELGNLPKKIKSIQLFFAGFTTPYTISNQEIWIAHVAESAFDAAPAVNFSDLTITNITQVKNAFNLTITNNNQWYQFDFDTHFNYNGTNNLLLIWKNLDGSATVTGAGYGRTSNATNRGMYKFNDPSYPTGDGTRISEILNAKFLWDWA